MASNCPACQSLSRMGIKCNAHRTSSKGQDLIREARAQGIKFQSTDYAARALEAEAFLGARKVGMN